MASLPLIDVVRGRSDGPDRESEHARRSDDLRMRGEWRDSVAADLFFWVVVVPSGVTAGGLAIAFAGGLLRSLLS